MDACEIERIDQSRGGQGESEAECDDRPVDSREHARMPVEMTRQVAPEPPHRDVDQARHPDVGGALQAWAYEYDHATLRAGAREQAMVQREDGKKQRVDYGIRKRRVHRSGALAH